MKKRKWNTEKEISGLPEIKKSLRDFNWKRLLLLLLLFGAVYGVYQFACLYCFKPIVHIYAAITFCLFISFAIVNRGFSRSVPDPDALPESWDEESKLRYIENDKKRKDAAKYILLILLPFLLTFLFDSIYLFLINR